MPIFTSFRDSNKLFFDLDKRETFAVSYEQYNKALLNFRDQIDYIRESNIKINPCFYIDTETGIHYNWIYKSDEQYDVIE